MRNVFLLIGGAAALYFLSRYQLSRKISFLLRGVRVGGGITSPTITIDLAIQNPTNQRAVVRSVSGEVSANGQYIANLSAFGEQTIQPNSESVIKLSARPSAAGVGQFLFNLIKQKQQKVSVNFTGTANIDGVTYPVNETRTL
jgi:LEA14-like dessication related protein